MAAVVVVVVVVVVAPGARSQLLSVCDCYDVTSSDQTCLAACVTVILQRI